MFFVFLLFLFCFIFWLEGVTILLMNSFLLNHGAVSSKSLPQWLCLYVRLCVNPSVHLDLSVQSITLLFVNGIYNPLASIFTIIGQIACTIPRSIPQRPRSHLEVRGQFLATMCLSETQLCHL